VTGATPQPDATRALFDEIAADYVARPGVSLGRMLRSEGLTVGGKVFAFLDDVRLVVKLPAPQAAAMVASGDAQPYEPRPGRRMREWVAVGLQEGAADEDRWRELVEAAAAYVGSLVQR